MKHITQIIVCAALLLFSLAGCGGANDSNQAIPLTDEETEIMEAMGDDITVVTDDDFVSTVTELQAHPGAFSGQVYQLEGVYSAAETVNGVETPVIYRTLIHDGEETICALPLKYLEKELPDGAWAKVTAIIGTEDYEGEIYTVLEIVAVETMTEAGQSQLEWDGVGHQH